MTANAPPVIDVGPLTGAGGDVAPVAAAIDAACRDAGFFSVVNHGIDGALLDRLEALARQFFALPEDEKAHVAMSNAGRAWRGWFPLGGELTSGVPDRKEGYYFGEELPADDPRVLAGVPLHGSNLLPVRPADLGPTVLEVIERFTALGHQLVRGLGLALDLDAEWFDRELTRDPVVLFRIFHYPARPAGAETPESWGVAEHTDYGLLTMLHQDAGGGLEVRTGDGWVEIPPRPGALVCNLGDMLERMTGGVYRSTPHRVRIPADRDRIACPFFFDPGWDAEVRAIDVVPTDDGPGGALRRSSEGEDRWDGASVHDFSGTYGDYLLAKVSKVFPALRDEALGAS